MENLLEVKNLNVSFLMGKRNIHILKDVSFNIEKNEVLAVIGETGCGKSVTGSAILHLLPENAEVGGSIKYNGIDITNIHENEFRPYRGTEIAAVPQSPSTSLDPLMKVGKQVSECVTDKKYKYGEHKKQLKESIINIFSKLKLPRINEIYDDYPCELSGGMNQRILISMGIVTKPKLLIVDEPTKAIDWALRKEVIEVFQDLKKERRCAMLFITHDIAAAKCVADRIAVMYCGQIVEIGYTNDILNNPKHPYTKGLIASMPSRGFHVMEGYMPSFADLPIGCRFEPRCSEKTDNCSKYEPQMFNIKNGYVKCFRYKL
ncbi:MAG: ABC transporter ATP-binding protein [Clostridia bacterium]|jgi:peptide/nickel transport system ATP-binding protein|nr:ABC transporter ATP-binding protein [Clostridia bacterium]